MKINPILQQSMMQSYRTGKTAEVNKGWVQEGADEVSFSEQALSFSKVLAGAKERMETRTASEKFHIAEIASQIQAGRYKIDSEKVAEKILKDIMSK